MVVGKRGTLLAVFVTCFLAQVLSQLTPREPRVDCPVGYTNQKTWFFNQRRNNEWGSLCPAYATCGTGFRQSPVNIPSLATNGRTPAKLQLSLGTVAVNLIRHADYLTFPVNNPNNTLNWRGATWTLNRLEFHSPSEHTIQGRYANFEVQLYFNNAGRTEQAAVALLFNCGGACDDAFFAKVIPALPSRYRCQCGNGRTETYNPYGAEQCDQGTDNANVPNRCRTTCQLPRCGDGITDDKNREECDSGAVNVTAGQTCRPNCILPYCGDGIVDAGEKCDKGIWWEGSGCTGTCQPECGDACLQPGEQCDYGIAGVGKINVTINHNDTAQAVTGSTCRFNCLWSRCGDNITDFNEECDWGDYANATSTGGAWLPSICRPNCTKPRCGDGVVDPLWSNVNATGTQFGGEQCEPSLSPQYCQQNCSWNCGNGRLDFNETCDNGTLNSLGASNASNPLCRPWNSVTPCRPASCGDNIVDFGEDCDSGGVDTWLCFKNCTFRCGNRQIDADFNETCDNGNPIKFPARVNDGNSDTRPNACRMNCQLYFCGDGVVDNLGCEQCDTGANRSDSAPNACRSNCRNAYCGDGVVDAGEECDDKNNVDDDGCSCCKRDCGNGIKQGAEDCDDGAANSNTLPDRCRLNCRRHFCGDGVVDSDEECDAGVNGSSTCTPRCTRTFCGDGVRQADQGEECDAGAANSYTALSGCSPVCTLNTCGQTLSGWTVDLNTLVPSNTIGTFTYAGSETRPPCTQNVRWFVVQQPRVLTAGQCRAFANIIPPATNRYLQGLYGRNPIAAPTTGVGMPPNDPRARAVCGDGIVQVGEECDDGRENDDVAPDACRTNCKANRCGDKVRDAGEECDGESFCLPSCKIDRRARRQGPPSDGQCSGNRQSPIRLPEACPRARALNLNHPSNVQYNPTPIVLFNTGNNILFPALNGGTFSYRGVTYTLGHIEFHEPSEHVIGNRRFPFEVQLFHKSQNPGPQSYAVLSILFAEGSSPNAVLQSVLDRLPPVSECGCGNGIKEDIQAFPDGTWVREECDDGANNNDELPNRCRSNCRLAHCGDGIVDSCKEQCDRGILNAFLPNRCRPTCVLPYCGDGIADDLMGETCDDGNNVNGDGCNSNCQVECGDGVQGQNEECDLGVYNSNEKASGCRTNCKLPRCGDGILDIGEQCDSGNLSATVPNACRPNCTLPVCGDGVKDDGEACDNGILNGNSTCTVTCTLLCGNGRLDNATGEQCDNGAANSNSVPNACRTNCRLPTCGDGVRDDGEDCDTGANTRQCQNCRVVCGNGILEAGEECDDGIYNSDTVPNACRTNCFLWACGDGVFDALEECDDGKNNANKSDACRPWCSIPKCGDGIVDMGRGETCDDGNNLDGDGCSSSCQKECGNGRVDPGEVCDDGPRNDDTKPACCRTNCRLPRCGDGVTDPGEECDDAGQNIAGPNFCRPDCTLPKCGDGIVDHLYGELCDQGGRNSLTTIDGCSPTCQPNVCRQSVSLNVTVNPGALLPTAPGTFHYQGSLTSAGCSENADWFVFANPVPISGCQLAQFRRVLSNNNRCLQARNGRPVNFLEVTAKCGDGIVEGNEECDAGPANSDFAPNACRRNCRLPRCGDGVQDKGEQCDGTPNCSQTCTFSCAAGNGTGAAAAAAAGAAASDNNEININFERILAQ